MKIGKVFRKDLGKWRWKIDITIAGQRIRRADFTTKREAIEAIAAMHTQVRAHRYGLLTPRPTVTLYDLYAEVKEDYAAKERRQILPTLDGFLKVVGPSTKLVDISRADWKKYLTDCKERELKPGTINRYMADISRALHSAPEHFPELGEWRPPSAPWEPAPLGRDRLLSAEELGKLLAALRSERQPREWASSVGWRYEVYDLFRLMLLLAAREGEVLNLRQAQISWDWKTVLIDATKTHTRRVIPLSDSALEILKCRKGAGQQVFKEIPKDALYNALDRAGEISGVTYGDNVENGWVIYDLRHAAATVIENSGVPYSAVSAILGHKRKDQTATYTHADLATMRRGLESLEAWCREIDGFSRNSAEIKRTTVKRRKASAA